MNHSHIIVELFNGCAGSCPGCMLSVNERKMNSSAWTPKTFQHFLHWLKSAEAMFQVQYLPIFGYGDFPRLPTADLHFFLDEIKTSFPEAGFTLTVADPSYDYTEALHSIRSKMKHILYDITVDPFRFQIDPTYAARLEQAIQQSDETHLTILLSKPVMARWTGQELALHMQQHLDYPVFIGLQPTLENLRMSKFQYLDTEAIEYAKTFYQTTPQGVNLINQDQIEYRETGEFSEFLRRSFVVGSDLNLYPLAYTVLGDISIDPRNLVHHPLFDISASQSYLSIQMGGPPSARDTSADLRTWTKNQIRFSHLNDQHLSQNDYHCTDCSFYESCRFHGIGLTQWIQKDILPRQNTCNGFKTMPAL